MIELKELPVLPKGKGNKIIQIPRKKLVSREELVKHLLVFDPRGCLVIHSGKRSFKLTPAIVKSYMGERGRRGRNCRGASERWTGSSAKRPTAEPSRPKHPNRPRSTIFDFYLKIAI